MYWEHCVESSLIFSRNPKPIAKKEHECCECGRTIKIGEKYSYFVGCWNDYYYNCGNQFGAYKTCLECEKDWDEILKVFHENNEREACHIFGLLQEAIQDAFSVGYLKVDDLLVQKWLNIPEERAISEKEMAISQMRIHSRPLL